MNFILKHYVISATFVSYLFIPVTGCQKITSNRHMAEDEIISAKPPSPQPPGPSDVSFWLTKGDRSALLQKQAVSLVFDTKTNRYPTIDVDSTQAFQTIDGFGYTLTTGSAYVINRMNVSARAQLLNELFGSDSNAISVSYLRVNIGASDLSPTVYSYDDMPAGQTDPGLENFNLAPDQADMIPVLKQIIAINPG